MSDTSDTSDALADPGHLFDQTNGVIEGLDGDADGTAGSDESSTADRALDDDAAAVDQEGATGTRDRDAGL